jgi:hypothetical protein
MSEMAFEQFIYTYKGMQYKKQTTEKDEKERLNEQKCKIKRRA